MNKRNADVIRKQGVTNPYSPYSTIYDYGMCFSRACLTISLIILSSVVLCLLTSQFQSIIAGIAKILDQLLLFCVLLLSDSLNSHSWFILEAKILR